ncbi:hypothetical protein NliqN6_0702 [Naganishia liquefaciens]|uniref:Elongation factor 1-beta n=1 Tax=Naganishia liquefaciens TaxID=104408 RepID=A0A8H3TPQ5_9TREE|nr:hypothetical protein NliqN6_0702 [Naganishia liquefaciens]
MAFSDLKQLEEHLASRAYIEGFEPTQADVAVYKAVKQAHPDFEYTAVARWFAHIKSYEAEHSALPGDASASAGLFGGASSSAPAAKAAEPAAEEDDDEVDLFGSDDEADDAETERIKAERVAEYQAKKAAKLAEKGPGPVAKSIVTLQVKPWDDETDMEALEKSVRSIEKDGLVWGASKLVPVGYGVRMLQINLVIEDEKISLDELQEEIADFEDYVQSSDVAAMQKL